MNTMKRKNLQFSVIAVAILAIATIATVLAATYATGPAQAQGAANNYPTPKPCGPGPNTNTAFQPEPHELTTGHYALFEAYWSTTNAGLGDDAAGVGTLHTNECPPLMVETTKRQGRQTVTVTTRSTSPSNIDIEEAIIHVKDDYKVDVVATNAAATGGQLSLQEYEEVREGLNLGITDPVPAGTKVWWLRLDDPDTTTADETSALSLGFSTALLDDKYWLTEADGQPMRYKFEVERYPADPSSSDEVPHFFTYRSPKAGNAQPELVWDSFRPDLDQDDMTLDPGEVEALQWVFTQPGTYILSVHLQGFVRKNNPHQPIDPGYDANWKPVSVNDTETSEVKKYTIQVGNQLAETEPPIFGVNLSVAENSPAGARVGDPIPVYNADADDLYYDLEGEGSENFETKAGTDPHTVQIVVKAGANLDYETRPSYDLTLTVTDKLDHEGNPQDEDKGQVVVDDTLIVRIALEDQEPGLVLGVDQGFPSIGETVNFIARYEPTPQQRSLESSYLWAEQIQTGNGVRWHVISSAPDGPTWSVSQSSQMRKTYRVAVELGNDIPPVFVESNEVEIFWGN